VGAWVRGCVGARGAWVRGCVGAWVRAACAPTVLVRNDTVAKARGCVGAWARAACPYDRERFERVRVVF